MAIVKVVASLELRPDGLSYLVTLAVPDSAYVTPLSLTICGFSTPNSDELKIPPFPIDALMQRDLISRCKVTYRVSAVNKQSSFIFMTKFRENIETAIQTGDTYRGGIVQSVNFAPFGKRVNAI